MNQPLKKKHAWTLWVGSAAVLAALAGLGWHLYREAQLPQAIAIPIVSPGRSAEGVISPSESLLPLAFPAAPTPEPSSNGTLAAAVALYREPAHRAAIDAFLRKSRRTADDYFTLPAAPIEALLAAAADRTPFLAVEPFHAITYDGQQRPDLIDLTSLARAVAALASYSLLEAGGNDPAAARRLFVGLHGVGQRLLEERLVCDELMLGSELLGIASSGLSALAKRGTIESTDDSLRRDDRTRLTVIRDRVLPVWRVISSVDNAVIDRHAGNVLDLARSSQERLWRVEATLKLGRYRYQSGSTRQRDAAESLLRQLQYDSDPAVAAAARAALALTRDQFLRLG